MRLIEDRSAIPKLFDRTYAFYNNGLFFISNIDLPLPLDLYLLVKGYVGYYSAETFHIHQAIGLFISNEGGL